MGQVMGVRDLELTRLQDRLPCQLAWGKGKGLQGRVVGLGLGLGLDMYDSR